jgi:hypothetical protein
LIAAGTWHRLGFAADLAANDVRYYLDGARVLTSAATGLLDQRFALFSNQDAGPDLVLFNEGDNSGNYTHAALYNSVGFIDRTLNDAEMAAIGGPSAAGIPFPSRPVQCSALSARLARGVRTPAQSSSCVAQAASA